MKNLPIAYCFLILSLLLISWGWKGHRLIGTSTSLFLNEEIFSHWPDILSAHASDADYRKGSDPDEGPRHYLDIDNYPEFDSTGRIPSTLDSVYMFHHPNFVKDQGYLPWATETTYDSLKSCFEQGDWDRAVLLAADLGHYVGDAHMPLHLTRNYDGQFSGNKGIHSRYESDMIAAYADKIIFEGDSIKLIGDVNAYIFNYIYHNYIFVDSVIAADDYATQMAGNTWSSTYTTALWEKTRSFTIPLFRNASRSLSELIYTAWVEAGSPSMNATDAGSIRDNIGTTSRKGIFLEQNYPNPFSRSTIVRFRLYEGSDVRLYVLDGSGKQIEILADSYLEEGEYSIEWSPDGIAPGLYYLVLSNRGYADTRRIMYMSPD